MLGTGRSRALREVRESARMRSVSLVHICPRRIHWSPTTGRCVCTRSAPRRWSLLLRNEDHSGGCRRQGGAVASEAHYGTEPGVDKPVPQFGEAEHANEKG